MPQLLQKQNPNSMKRQYIISYRKWNLPKWLMYGTCYKSYYQL